MYFRSSQIRYLLLFVYCKLFIYYSFIVIVIMAVLMLFIIAVVIIPAISFQVFAYSLMYHLYQNVVFYFFVKSDQFFKQKAYVET